MVQRSKKRSLIKKITAVTLGITIAFGGLMLPDSFVKGELTAASADIIEVNGCKFDYYFENDRGVSNLVLSKIPEHGETVEIPAYINHNGVDYPVYKIDSNFLKDDQTVKTVIFPETVKVINTSTLQNSSVENIVLPDGLENLGVCFAASCPNLKSVDYNGTSLKNGEVGWDIFRGSDVSCVTNEKGAIVLGNCLIQYAPDSDATELRIADLGNGDIPIEIIAPDAVRRDINGEKLKLTTIDLEGVKSIGINILIAIRTLTTVLNTDDIEYVESNVLGGCPWRDNAEKGDCFRIGKALIHYKTDSTVLDLTSGKPEGVKWFADKSLDDCKNIDTIICNSDCNMRRARFNVINELYKEDTFREDPLPEKPTYAIKDIYLDGKKITYQRLKEDPAAYAWMKENFHIFTGSVLTNSMIEEKTKELFKELDITYYGMDNDKIGTLSPTEEFYIRLKISNYLSAYDYDHGGNYYGMAAAFLLGGKMTCTSYAELTHYLLECAGVEAKTFYSDPTDPDTNGVHFWNATKLGDEWFYSDDGWSAQTYHNYGWFLMSYDKFNTSEFHTMMDSYDSFHFYPESKNTEKITADRYYGDQDGDDDRDQDDVDILWDFIKDKPAMTSKKRADMNFDGKIDVTDAVLLDRIVNGKALDVDNIPIDGLAPGICVAFINGDDYDNIKYLWTERGGYITLPYDLFEAPEGKKVTYDVGRAGQKVRLTTPVTVVTAKWIDKNAPDYILGDVNDDSNIDIEDAVAIIQHINGGSALDEEQMLRADVSKDKRIDIDDAVILISYINGNSTF